MILIGFRPAIFRPMRVTAMRSASQIVRLRIEIASVTVLRRRRVAGILRGS
jgi:hypothetical protein